jgi:hypothetical protein
LGAVEGPFAALLVGLTGLPPDNPQVSKYWHPAGLALAFFVVAISPGLVGGWQGALFCGAINACLGGLIGLWCRARIRAREQERELADPFDRR